MQVPLHNI